MADIDELLAQAGSVGGKPMSSFLQAIQEVVLCYQ